MTASKFRVFLGWSGEVSRAVASALWHWLPDVLQFIDPWLSHEDIEKGARWNPVLAEKLFEAQFGIFCLTPENLHSLWIPFEAGCLSRNVGDDRICPYLFLVPPVSTPAPLVQFQVTEATEVETERMLRSINTASGALAISDSRLARAFQAQWPALKETLKKLELADIVAPPPKPLTDDLLAEILETVRGIARRPGNPLDFKLDAAAIAAQLKGPTWGTEFDAKRVVAIPPWTADEMANGFRVLQQELGTQKADMRMAAYLQGVRMTARAPGALEQLARAIAGADQPINGLDQLP